MAASAGWWIAARFCACWPASRGDRRRHGAMSSAPSGTTNAALLKRVQYFGSLPAAEVRRVAARCATRTLRTGEILFEEGQPCRGLFIVAEGSIEIRQTSVRGREQVFHAEGPGAAL